MDNKIISFVIKPRGDYNCNSLSIRQAVKKDRWNTGFRSSELQVGRKNTGILSIRVTAASLQPGRQNIDMIEC